MTEMEKLQKLTGEGDTDLLALLLDDAEEYAKSYTGRKRIPDDLKKTVRDLTVIAYHRLGTEGESARTGAGESYTFADIPQSIYNSLNRFRLAHVGGKTYESQT